jgi:predicted RNase H-like HicB family nuclease
MVEREEEGGYVARFPALPGCQTWGATYEHAVQMAEEALLGYLEALEKSGKKVPVEMHRASGISLGLVVDLPVIV